jgi:hypothetical protein
MEEKSSVKMDMNGVLKLNQLDYKLPSNLSCIENRENLIMYADVNQYTSQGGNEIVIRMNSSVNYIYGKNCFLALRVVATGGGPNPVSFVKNTALSLFSRGVLETKDGQQVERNDALDLYSAGVLPYYYDDQCCRSLVANAGQYEQIDFTYEADGEPNPAGIHKKNGVQNQYNVNVNQNADGVLCIIPLRWIFGAFNCEKLLPSYFASGAIVRLQLNSAARAFMTMDAGSVADVTGYQINNPRIVIDSMTLSPVIQKNLQERSQNGGLDFVYNTNYYQSASTLTKDFNLQVNKAVSRCNKLSWFSQYNIADSLGVVDGQPIDNLGATVVNIRQLDYRIGSDYMPARPLQVVGDVTVNGGELYENTLQSIRKQETNDNQPAVDKVNYLLSGTAPASQNNNNGRAIHCQDFETSSALRMTGRSINNSRTLEARIQFDVAPVAGQQIHAWIEYVKLIKCNQLRSVIKE